MNISEHAGIGIAAAVGLLVVILCLWQVIRSSRSTNAYVGAPPSGSTTFARLGGVSIASVEEDPDLGAELDTATEFDEVIDVLEQLPDEGEEGYDADLYARAVRKALELADTSADALRVYDYTAEDSDLELEAVERALSLTSTISEAMEMAEAFEEDSGYWRQTIVRAADLIKADAPYDEEEEGE